MIDRHFLQSHALFGGVSDDDMPLILAHLHQECYDAGSYLFHQGEAGDRLFLIVQGRVEVLNETEKASPVRLAIRQVGDSVGEMALIDIQNRSASVRALEPVNALSLSNHDLHSIYQSRPLLYTQIIINIAREISRRLRMMDTLLSCTLYGAANGAGSCPYHAGSDDKVRLGKQPAP